MKKIAAAVLATVFAASAFASASAPAKAEPAAPGIGPAPQDQVLEISNRRIDDYLTCPLKYLYAHVAHVPLAGDPAFMYGNAVDLHRTVYDGYTLYSLKGDERGTTNLITPERLVAAAADPFLRVAVLLASLIRFSRRLEQELLQRQYSDRFTALMRFQAERAHALYDEALALLPAADRRSQKPGLMMASIYRTLLREIEASGFQVLHQRIGLTPLRKLWLAWKMQALGRF